jgi:hypothetical protein
MKCDSFKHYLPAILSLCLLWVAQDFAGAQSARDVVEVMRSDLKTDRKALIAEQMALTDQESNAFWPLYRSYRDEVDRANDTVVNLLLEYADLYPNVPDAKATEMLKSYAKTEEKLFSIRKKYLKKFSKILPPSKLFRFAQLDNRLDLSTRVGMAVSIPLMPGGAPQPAAATNAR